MHYSIFRVLSSEKNILDISKLKPKLYKIKGKRSPIISELTSVDWKHFNSRDVFLIHTPKIVFVWVGRASNPTEKLHGAKVKLAEETQQKACLTYTVLIYFVSIFRSHLN